MADHKLAKGEKKEKKVYYHGWNNKLHSGLMVCMVASQ